jgi:hypothetical protein
MFSLQDHNPYNKTKRFVNNNEYGCKTSIKKDVPFQMLAAGLATE